MIAVDRQRSVRFLCVLAPLREKEKRDKREYQVQSTKYQVQCTKYFQNHDCGRQAKSG